MAQKELKSGDLDRRIIVLRGTETTNDFNEPVFTWSTLISVWASYSPVSDGERYRAGEIGAHELARFVIRHSVLAKTVNAKDRLSFDGKIWEISGVKTIGRMIGYEITAHTRPDLV